MQDGQIAVLDSGAETMMGYASDITRTIPVNGKFTEKQKAIYNIVLDSQLKSIEMMKPGVKFKDVHLTAAKVIAAGLKEIGIMKGNVEEAVEKGAHALFFPSWTWAHDGTWMFTIWKILAKIMLVIVKQLKEAINLD